MEAHAVFSFLEDFLDFSSVFSLDADIRDKGELQKVGTILEVFFLSFFL